MTDLALLFGLAVRETTVLRDGRIVVHGGQVLVGTAPLTFRDEVARDARRVVARGLREWREYAGMGAGTEPSGRDILDALHSDVTIHACPPGDSGTMPCCGRTVFEARGDRITTDPALITCRSWYGDLLSQTVSDCRVPRDRMLVLPPGAPRPWEAMAHQCTADAPCDARRRSGPPVDRCHGASDGECFWERCPQLRDGEPHATGRHCPLDVRDEEDMW